MRRYSEEFRKEAVRKTIELRKQGLDIRTIARRLNIKHGTLLNWCFRYHHHGVAERI